MIKTETNIKQVVKHLHHFPTMLRIAANRTLSNTVIEILRIMRRAGLPIRYPVQWDSEKQRIYVIAKLSREGNLPYARTQQTQNGWKSESITNGYMVSNIGHKAVYVYGTVSGVGSGTKTTRTGQSHIHAGRWPVFHEVWTAVVKRLPQDVIRAIAVEFGKQ